MLQIASYDGYDPNIVTDPWNSRPDGADTPHHKIHLDARLRGFIQPLDHAGIQQRIDFCCNAGRAAFPGMADLCIDPLI